MRKIFDETIYIYFVSVYIAQTICLYEIEMVGSIDSKKVIDFFDC